MGFQPGRNYGVTGLIDFQMEGQSTPAVPLISATIIGFVLALSADAVEVSGPGDSNNRTFVSALSSAEGTASADMVSSQRPFPPVLRNVKANLIHQADTACKITIPALLKSILCTRTPKTKDQWHLEITWVKSGQETIAWNGSTVSYTPPTLTTKELFADTQKITDPNVLTTNYTVKYYLPIAAVAGSTSTDAAGNAAVDAWIAAATAPRATLKVVDTMLLRLDDTAGLLLVRWGLKDSRDEYELKATGITSDPNVIKSAQTIGNVFDNSTPPSQPTAPSGLKFVDYEDVSITPAKSLRIWKFGTNDSKDEIERSMRHGTMTTIDSATVKLDGHGRVAKVAATQPGTPTAPTGTKIVDVTTHPVTDALNLYIFNYGLNNSNDQLQLMQSQTDASTIPLDTTAAVPLIDATPSVPSGLKLINTHTRQLGGGHVLNTAEAGLRTRQNQIEYDGSLLTASPFNTDNAEHITTIETCSAGDAIETLAQTAYTAAKGTTSPTQGVPFRYLRARRYHDTAWIKTLVYQGYNYIPPQPTSKSRLRLNGFGLVKASTYLYLKNVSGTIKPHVRVGMVLSRGSGKYMVQLQKYEITAVGGTLIVDQRIVAASAPLGGSSLGKTNNAAMFGFDIGTLTYVGGDFDVFISDTSSTFDMHYKFAYMASFFGDLTGVGTGGLIHTTAAPTAYADLVADTVASGVWTWSTVPGLRAIIPTQDAMAFNTWSQT